VKHAVKLIRPIASMYLAFPAGSSAAERGFTYATVTKLRANISDDKLEELIIIQDYLKHREYNFNDIIQGLADYIEEII